MKFLFVQRVKDDQFKNADMGNLVVSTAKNPMDLLRR